MNKRVVILTIIIALFIAACQTQPTAVPTLTNGSPTAILPTSSQDTPEPVISLQDTPTNSPPDSSPTTAPTAATVTPPSTSVPTGTTPPTATTSTVQTASTEAAVHPASGEAIIIDHTSLELFDQIPDEYLEKARNLRVVFFDASVGQNVSTGLDCLASSSWAESPVHCRRDYVDANWNWQNFSGTTLAGNVPERIRFTPDPEKYDRSNWEFVRSPGTWYSATEKFITQHVPQYAASKDVLSYKITYTMVDDKNGISDPKNGFFSTNPNGYGWEELKAVIAQYPDNTFFLWTSSLSRSIGSKSALEFNEKMRQTALEEGLFLFDIADIESHTDQGVPCYDNRDGVEYCSEGNKCENHPDDGQNLPAICQDYTTETDGGHLGSVSGGKIRLAKAFWVLIARIAGWQP